MGLRRRLAEARRAAGLSQDELAERVGCSQATVARLEQGKHMPLADLALKIAETLAIPPADVLAEESETGEAA